MKRLLIALSMVLFFVCSTVQAEIQDTKERLIHDTLITTLTPHIANAVAGHYGELTQFDLFDAEFLDIKRQTEGGYSFTVKVQILPFEGAHNTIGKDTITMDVNTGNVRVIKYEHKDL
ncbi:DUF3888 domain-containing protein [Ectobacillus panaciterrae]|uniref:DUF3888 domain-containing protein n=1 Tax=Ectobacillus panaciterrae TaxID=363872 RepID=UPI00048A8A60|nr:DUF3888 domain-containing protein [Ectobacillus panaciterrae]